MPPKGKNQQSKKATSTHTTSTASKKRKEIDNGNDRPVDGEEEKQDEQPNKKVKESNGDAKPERTNREKYDFSSSVDSDDHRHCAANTSLHYDKKILVEAKETQKCGQQQGAEKISAQEEDATNAAASVLAAAAATSTNALLNRTSWPSMPVDWFSYMTEYLDMKEFYRVVSVCRQWHANESRMKPRSYSLVLKQGQHVSPLVNAFIKGIHAKSTTPMSVRTRHIGSITTDERGLSFVQRDGGRAQPPPSIAPDLHFPCLHSLQLSLSRTPRIELQTEFLGVPADPWRKVDDMMKGLLVSAAQSLTSLHLELDFWEGHFGALKYLSTLSLLSPIQLQSFSLRLGTDLHRWSGDAKMSKGMEKWPDALIERVRSWSNLIHIDIPPMKMLADWKKLYDRPLPWSQLLTLRVQGGANILQQWFIRSQHREGWPRIMPQFFQISIDGKENMLMQNKYDNEVNSD